MVRMSQAPQSIRTFFVTSTTAGRVYGIGRPATRAKALNSYTGAFSRVENPLPRTKSPGLAQLWSPATAVPITSRQTNLDNSAIENHVPTGNKARQDGSRYSHLWLLNQLVGISGTCSKP